MPAYVIADINVSDREKYGEYRRQVAATLDKFGGRFLVRGGEHETLEGSWQPARIVLLEFPDMDALRAWYRSPEYAPLITLRQAASTGHLVAVQGV